MPEIKGLCVLDGEGACIAAKYFSKPESSDKGARGELERRMFKKSRGFTARETELVSIDGYNAAFRLAGDVVFWVLGGPDENELILVAVLDAWLDAMTSLLRGSVERKSLLSNLELLLLAMDELIDGGIILEIDPAAIEARVWLRGAVPDSISSYREATMGSVLEKLRDRTSKQFSGKT